MASNRNRKTASPHGQAGRRTKPKAEAGPGARRVLWLEDAYQVLRRGLLPEAPPVDKVNLIPAFPHRGARPGPRQVAGIAWDDKLQGLGRSRSPAIELHLRQFAEPVTCLAALLHSMIHLTVGVDRGHRRAFQVRAAGVGFEPPFAEIRPTKALRERLRRMLRTIGPIPPGWADLDPPRPPKAWRYACSCPRPQCIASYGKAPVDASCPHCGQHFRVTAAPGQVEKRVLPAGAMDIHELAKILGRKVRTIWDRVAKGKLPGPKLNLGRRAYWLPEQFDQLEADRVRKPKPRDG